MLIYLNPYVTVVRRRGNYEFPEFSGERHDLNDRQEEVFLSLLSGEGIEKKELETLYSAKTIQEWSEKKIITMVALDKNDLMSRTKSYYWHKGIGDMTETLRKKTILILGCGGLGTHVAWNMVAMGVGKVILLDKDVVEVTNLNRQILFDLDDVGKVKTEVLKNKLQKISTTVQIQTINEHIESEEHLRRILTETMPDCCVKALDSPIYFPVWLDTVCGELKIKYVTGIISNTAQMIGPTYIPEESASYSDMMVVDMEGDRIGGIAPSIGFTMYQMAGKLSEEIFMVLTDTGELMYKNKIDIINNLCKKGEMGGQKITSKIAQYARDTHNGSVISCVHIIAIFFTFFIGNFLGIRQQDVMLVVLLYTVLVPVIVYDNACEAMKSTMIAVIAIFVCNIVIIYGNNGFQLVPRQFILPLISIIFMSMSISILLINLLQALLLWLKQNLLYRR